MKSLCFLFGSDTFVLDIFVLVTFNNLVMRIERLKKLNNAQERDKMRSDNNFYGQIGIFFY